MKNIKKKINKLIKNYLDNKRDKIELRELHKKKAAYRKLLSEYVIMKKKLQYDEINLLTYIREAKADLLHDKYKCDEMERELHMLKESYLNSQLYYYGIKKEDIDELLGEI